MAMQVCFCRRLFSDTAKPRGCSSWPVWPLRGINKTAWGAKLILTADLVYQVGCASLGYLLMAQHCHLYLNVCFSLPTAPHPPQPPTPPPSPPPTPYRLNPHYYSHRKTTSKARGVQTACRISYEILAIYNYAACVASLAWLYCTIREPQPIQYLKSVFLEILNVTTWSVFQNKVTYIELLIY